MAMPSTPSPRYFGGCPGLRVMIAAKVNTEEGAAYGAALLAGVGCGAWASVDAACEMVVRVASRVEPYPASMATMNRRYAAYRSLYAALRNISYEG